MNATVLVLSDIHVPYHDKNYVSIATKLIKILKPDHVCQLGDALDFSGISSYLQNPKDESRIFNEIETYNKILDEWQGAMKKGSTFHQLEGNHSQRAQRYVAKNCREIHEIVREIPDLLKIKERSKSGVKFIWHPLNNWKSCKLGNVFLHHGTYYDKNLAVSNLDRYGVNFIQGHAHRFSYASNGDVWSVSLGHGSLADKTNHIPGPCIWQQAMGVVTIINGKGHFEPILVNDGLACFRGKLIRG
jgi:predicted phosphodiesterase